METATVRADRLIGHQVHTRGAGLQAEPSPVSVREGGGVFIGALLGALLWAAILYGIRLI